jgi:CheY-like chemotaxis protein
MDKPRILVVEDEAIVSADIQDRLLALGYAVAGSADTGEAAIRLAAELKPDLILMDIMLKGDITGTEAAARIRSQQPVPVVYLTANSNDETFLKARDTGPFGFILKPFEEATLKVSIEIALYKHRAEREREDLIRQLQAALEQVKILSGMIPICASCKQIRDDQGYWNQVETYIARQPGAQFSHGYCPECAINFLKESGIEASADLIAAAEQSRLAKQNRSNASA